MGTGRRQSTNARWSHQQIGIRVKRRAARHGPPWTPDVLRHDQLSHGGPYGGRTSGARSSAGSPNGSKTSGVRKAVTPAIVRSRKVSTSSASGRYRLRSSPDPGSCRKGHRLASATSLHAPKVNRRSPSTCSTLPSWARLGFPSPKAGRPHRAHRRGQRMVVVGRKTLRRRQSWRILRWSSRSAMQR